MHGGEKRSGKEENINDVHTVSGKSTLPGTDPHPVNYPSLSPGSRPVFRVQSLLLSKIRKVNPLLIHLWLKKKKKKNTLQFKSFVVNILNQNLAPPVNA